MYIIIYGEKCPHVKSDYTTPRDEKVCLLNVMKRYQGQGWWLHELAFRQGSLQHS